MKITKNKNLKDYNTYKLNAICKTFIEIDAEEELIKLISNIKEPYKIIGNGSNLILPEYINGIIIHLNLKVIYIKNNEITASSGILLPNLVNKTINNNLTGLEWASGIPASLGGAIMNNAGAYKHSILDYITKIKVLENNQIKEITKDEIKASHHQTNLKNKNIIILSATLKLEKGNKEESLNLIKEYTQKRINSQPINYPSAGSVFQNPEGDYAGKIIESLGLKNFHIKDAYISEKHANFIINKGSATSKDILELIKIIKEQCKREYNINLKLEQEIINENLK